MLSAKPALADDEAAGRVLFSDAMALMKKGALSEACPKFEESLRQSYNINAHYFLAECLEKQGKTASAWTTFLSAASKAKAAGDEKREQVARTRAGALEPKLVKLKLVVPVEIEGLEVRRNGSVMGKPMWGTLVPVDPGEIEFTASASGYESYKTVIRVFGEGRTYEVTIPRLTRKAEAADQAEPAEETPSREPEAAPRRVTSAPRPAVRPIETKDTPAESNKTSLSTYGWWTTGVGAAAMLGGGIVGLVAKSSFSDAKSAFDACDNADCQDANIAKERSARGTADVATGLVIGGAAVAAVGLVLVLADSGSDEAPRKTVSVKVHPTGISLAGSF